MSDGYPFVGIVREKDTNYYVSPDHLEKKGANSELIQAIVHGPIELAMQLIEEWNTGYTVEPNPGLFNED